VTPALKRIVLIAAAVRLASLSVILVAHSFIPFSVPHHDANFVYPIGEQAGLVSAFKTWDANHYLFLAEQGYEPLHISNAYYPLLPLLIRVVRVATFGDALVAGLLVSNVLALLAIAVFHQLVARTHGEEVATASSLLLLAFPTAFYLGLVYTESLFLALAAALLLLIRAGRPGAAALVALLLPLSRPTGILMSIPAAVALGLAWWKGEIREPLRLAAVPLGFAVGLLAYFAIMWGATGDPFAGFDAQRVFLADNSLSRLLHPLEWFESNFVNVDLSVHGFRTSALDRLFFLLFVGLVIFSFRRRLAPDLLACLVVLGAVPALTGSFTSYPRYLLVAFPIFVSLALLLRDRVWLRAVLAGSALAQLGALVFHASNRWLA
jgi:Gpi18-like mannosyltransferase